MFTLLSLVVIAFFCAFALGLPFVRTAWMFRFLYRYRHRFPEPRCVVIPPRATTNPSSIWWIRSWGVLAAGFLLLFSWTFGYTDFTTPGSVGLTILYSAAAVVAAAMMVTFVVSVKNFAPGWQMSSLLRKCGIQGLWSVTPGKKVNRVQQMLNTRALDTSYIGMIGVTGGTLLGNGSGPQGGLLYDAFRSADTVPGRVLLLHPGADTIDPEHKKMTVIEDVLFELEVTEEVFRRQLRATIEAVDDLNTEREKTEQIEIRLYSEKPSLVGAFFDEDALVASWQPHSKTTVFTSVESKRSDASLFTVYRSHFLRLWSAARTITPQLGMVLRQGSQVVRMRKVTA